MKRRGAGEAKEAVNYQKYNFLLPNLLSPCVLPGSAISQSEKKGVPSSLVMRVRETEESQGEC